MPKIKDVSVVPGTGIQVVIEIIGYRHNPDTRT